LEFDFVIISLKKHNLATLRNFGSPKSEIKGRWGGEPPALGDFKKFVTKIMHFRHISVKNLAPKLKTTFRLGGSLATP